MNQHDFDILLQKYLSGECSPEEEREIVAWSDRVWENAQPDLAVAEQKALGKRMWAQISQGAFTRTSRLITHLRSYAGLAAALLIVSGLSAYMLLHQARPAAWPANVPVRQKVVLAGDWMEVKNLSKAGDEVLSLEDGTIVTLGSNSSLRYPRHFDPKNREVQLEGEAVFNVKRDVNRPFFVYSGELVTQVLGTSFKVRSFEDAGTIEVQVLSGKVSVYENQQKSPQARNGVILRPNQKITFDKASRKLVPELVEVPVMVEAPASQLEFAFEESPLSAVLEAIRKAYDVEIVVANPALNDCTFTGDISGLPLHTQLRFICKSVNATYELRGTTVFITGPLTP